MHSAYLIKQELLNILSDNFYRILDIYFANNRYYQRVMVFYSDIYKEYDMVV